MDIFPPVCKWRTCFYSYCSFLHAVTVTPHDLSTSTGGLTLLVPTFINNTSGTCRYLVGGAIPPSRYRGYDRCHHTNVRSRERQTATAGHRVLAVPTKRGRCRIGGKLQHARNKARVVASGPFFEGQASRGSDLAKVRWRPRSMQRAGPTCFFHHFHDVVSGPFPFLGPICPTEVVFVPRPVARKPSSCSFKR